VSFVPEIRGFLHVLRERWSKVHGGYKSLSATVQAIVDNAIIWSVAALCIWWVSRGLSFEAFIKALHGAKIWLFVLVNIISLLFWWLGDTVVFSTLFSFFHKKTGLRELLPATAAQYFIQAINILAADGALIVFLNRRKGVKWLTATWTMMFMGLIDALSLASVTTLAALLMPDSTIRIALPWAGGALCFLVLVAIWWAKGEPKTRPEKWMYNRPSAKTFREAGWREYLVLGALRVTMISVQALLYAWSIQAFAPKVPFVQVLGLSPAIQAASNEPLTPQGLGPIQALFVDGLAKYAPRDRILAAALGISVLAVLCRLPLGLGAAGTFARRVLAIRAGKEQREA
jgi:uncharacterized membrane protein YbhN (UPF0104 family)